MELLNPVEGVPCDWLSSPRISFSQDFDVLARSSPDTQRREILAGDVDDEFSFEFGFAHSVGLDLPLAHGMLSADELFFGGKLRLLEKSSNAEQEQGQWQQPRSESPHFMGKDETVPWPMTRHVKTYNDNPRCISMSVEGSREPHRGCLSLNNSRCSSPSRSFSLPPTMPASPKASSSRYSSKFKDFFRLRKTHIPMSREVPPSSSFSASLTVPSSSSSSSSSAAISRESSVVSSSCRLPLCKRSFWPFSRSNSAGESKSGHAVSPPPRRSNSAGESKTASSSLLPSARRNTPYDAKANIAPTTDAKLDGNPLIKKGLPPLPNLPRTVKKGTGSHSFRVPAHCGADAVALSSRSVPSVHLPMTSSSPSMSQKPTSVPGRANGKHLSSVSADGCRECDHNAAGASAIGCVSPVRRFSTDDTVRIFARESPNRGRGMWDSPSRGSNGGRGSIRNYERGNGVVPKGLVRPKDMLTRDTASIRVTPVLNVPACITPSLRGTKSMPRAKVFSIGNVFSKKERALYSNGVLLPSDKQNGA